MLTIKTATTDSGTVEYVLVDSKTGEELIRGSWKEVHDMKALLSVEAA